MKQRYQKLCSATLRPLDKVIALAEKKSGYKGRLEQFGAV